MKSEFDDYIKNYRSNNDNALWLSGESSDFFADYKAQKLREWFFGNYKTILDFGCGDGMMMSYVQQYFSHSSLYGVDPSSKSIAEAQQHFPSMTFHVNSETSSALNFDSNYFDIIYSAGTFHHIPFNQHEAYILELIRILKPNGSLIIFELNPINPLTVYTFKKNPIDQHATMLTPWYTHKLLKQYGAVNVRFIAFFPKFLSLLRWSEKFLVKFPIGALYAATLTKVI